MYAHPSVSTSRRGCPFMILQRGPTTLLASPSFATVRPSPEVFAGVVKSRSCETSWIPTFLPHSLNEVECSTYRQDSLDCHVCYSVYCISWLAETVSLYAFRSSGSAWGSLRSNWRPI